MDLKILKKYFFFIKIDLPIGKYKTFIKNFLKRAAISYR